MGDDVLVGGIDHDRRGEHAATAADRRVRECHLARVLVDHDRLLPSDAVRRDLDVKVVVACQAEHGEAGEAGLEQVRGGVTGGLGDLLVLGLVAVVLMISYLTNRYIEIPGREVGRRLGRELGRRQQGTYGSKHVDVGKRTV